MDRKKGVLINSVPHIEKGVHYSFTSDFGEMWAFDLYMKVGNETIKGVAYSKKPEGSLTLQTEYMFDMAPNKKGETTFKNIKKAEDKPQSSTYKSYYDDPLVQVDITLSWARKLAITSLDLVSDKVLGVDFLFGKFYDYVIDNSSLSAEYLKRRQSMEIAVEAMRVPELNINNWDKLTEYAKKEYNILTGVKEEAPVGISTRTGTTTTTQDRGTTASPRADTRSEGTIPFTGAEPIDKDDLPF